MTNERFLAKIFEPRENKKHLIPLPSPGETSLGYIQSQVFDRSGKAVMYIENA